MISSTTNWTQATITSLPQTIAVPFVFTNTSDLLVQDSRTSPPLTLVLGSDYTVSGGGGAVGSIAVVSTGSNAVLSGEIITISRLVPETQTTGFVNGGFLNPAQIENALDKLTEQTQQIGNTVSKSLQFQNDETLSGVIPLTARKSKYLAFDANGNIALVAGTSGIPPTPSNSFTWIAWTNLVNVKAYGAAGDGVTDDTAAIANAFVAVTSNSAIYFPAGTYVTSGQFAPPASVTNVTIFGDGWTSILKSNTPQIAISTITKIGTTATVTTSSPHGLSNGQNMQIAGATGADAGYYNGTFTITYIGASSFSYTMTGTPAGNATGTLVCAKNINLLTIPSTCSQVLIKDMAFLGTGPWRTQSILLSVNSSYTQVNRCSFSMAGNFALRFTNDSSTTYSLNQSAVGNFITNCYGDGIHFANSSGGLAESNTIYNVGDDGIAFIADTVGYGPKDCAAIGNQIAYSGYQLSTPVNITASGAGIDIRECTDILIQGNIIHYAKQAGIEVTRYQSASAYNVRVKIIGNKMEGCDQIGGTGSIDFEDVNNCDIIGNNIDDTGGSAQGIYIGNLQNCTISSNTFSNNATSIYANTTTTDSSNQPLASSVGVIITNNVTKSTTASAAAAIYLNPSSTYPYSRVVISGNTFDNLAGLAIYSRTTYVTGSAFNNGSYNGSEGYTYGSLIGNAPSFLTLGVGAAAPVSGGTGGSVIITPVPASSTAVAAVNVQGSLNAPASTDLHPNAFRDTTIFTPVVNGDAYASYDTYASLGGTIAPNHFYGYQARISYSGSGTFGGPMAAFATLNMGVAGTGSVPFMRGFYVSNPSVSGGGSCGQFDGIYIDQLSAATANNAIYIAGNNRLFMAGGQILTSDLLANIEGATTARVQACFDQTSQTGYAVKNKNSTGTGVCYGVYNNGGTYQGGIVQTNTTTTAFPTSSDSRLKENVRNLADVGSIIDSIQPVVFDWRWGGKDAHGFIAQELYSAYAPAVHVGEDDADGKMERPWGVDYSKLVPILTAEIKSLRARLTAIGA